MVKRVRVVDDDTDPFIERAEEASFRSGRKGVSLGPHNRSAKPTKKNKSTESRGGPPKAADTNKSAEDTANDEAEHLMLLVRREPVLQTPLPSVAIFNDVKASAIPLQYFEFYHETSFRLTGGKIDLVRYVELWLIKHLRFQWEGTERPPKYPAIETALKVLEKLGYPTADFREKLKAMK